jgi:uncharacterized protein (TIGR02444 family)
MNSDKSALEHPFWDFSLAVYSTEGVSAELVAIQDTFEIDVNLILFCLWLGFENGIELSSEQLDSLHARSTHWHSATVVPLRGVRRYLKMGTAAQSIAQRAAELRSQVKQLELLSEQIEQAILYEWFLGSRAKTGDGNLDVAVTNLKLFMNRVANGWDRERTSASFPATLAAIGSLERT